MGRGSRGRGASPGVGADQLRADAGNAAMRNMSCLCGLHFRTLPLKQRSRCEASGRRMRPARQPQPRLRTELPPWPREAENPLEHRHGVAKARLERAERTVPAADYERRTLGAENGGRGEGDLVAPSGRCRPGQITQPGQVQRAPNGVARSGIIGRACPARTSRLSCRPCHPAASMQLIIELLGRGERAVRHTSFRRGRARDRMRLVRIGTAAYRWAVYLGEDAPATIAGWRYRAPRRLGQAVDGSRDIVSHEVKLRPQLADDRKVRSVVRRCGSNCMVVR